MKQKLLNMVVVLFFIVTSAKAQDAQPAQFDYWALTLSWSPTFCESAAGRNNHQQCGPGRRFAFVIHGLWPQYEHGWPADCGGNTYVPSQVITGMLDVMPSKGLIIHQWRKHGTCSGLSQQDYFALTRKLFKRIIIPARYIEPIKHLFTSPEQMRHDFLATNRDLEATYFTIHCGNRRDRANLSELRICFDRDLEFRSCGINERRQCRANQLVLPPVRAP